MPSTTKILKLAAKILSLTLASVAVVLWQSRPAFAVDADKPPPSLKFSDPSPKIMAWLKANPKATLEAFAGQVSAILKSDGLPMMFTVATNETNFALKTPSGLLILTGNLKQMPDCKFMRATVPVLGYNLGSLLVMTTAGPMDVPLNSDFHAATVGVQKNDKKVLETIFPVNIPPELVSKDGKSVMMKIPLPDPDIKKWWTSLAWKGGNPRPAEPYLLIAFGPNGYQVVSSPAGYVTVTAKAQPDPKYLLGAHIMAEDSQKIKITIEKVCE